MRRYRCSTQVFEDYHLRRISLRQASLELRRLRGTPAPFLLEPFEWLGWWVQRLLHCNLGVHAWFEDEFVRVPGYSATPLVCFVCNRVKVDPRKP